MRPRWRHVIHLHRSCRATRQYGHLRRQSNQPLRHLHHLATEGVPISRSHRPLPSQIGNRTLLLENNALEPLELQGCIRAGRCVRQKLSRRRLKRPRAPGSDSRSGL